MLAVEPPISKISKMNDDIRQPLDPDEVIGLVNSLVHDTDIEKEVITFNISNTWSEVIGRFIPPPSRLIYEEGR